MKNLLFILIAPIFIAGCAVHLQQIKQLHVIYSQKNNLEKHVRVLSEDIGERNFIRVLNLDKAAKYIKTELEGYGYSVQEQTYSVKDMPETVTFKTKNGEEKHKVPKSDYKNLIAVKGGKDKEKLALIVCAHYDSVVGSPGANDNASGVAALLELARLLSRVEVERTIKFIAFTNEEPPFFKTAYMGSMIYAYNARRDKADILGVYCLETIGHYTDKENSQKYPSEIYKWFLPSTGNFVMMIGNTDSGRFIKETKKIFNKTGNFPAVYFAIPESWVPDIGFSDHGSFWKYGYKGLMITDTAYSRYNYYHSQEDTFDKLNFDALNSLVEGLYSLILRI